MNDEFPFLAVEMLNGILSVVLLWMFFFIMLHLHHAWRILASHWGKGRAILKMYHTNKPEIALATMIGAFWFRTTMLWYTRWIRNHGVQGWYIVDEYDAQILIASTIVMVIGIACWIRVISPYSGKLAFWLWVAMVSSSLAFGLGMHYFF